ncbi:cell adhesion molecule CEACAM5-like [Xenentodon cancila]
MQSSGSPMVQSQEGWGVNYYPTQICAPKGSTVEIHCRYKHPNWYIKVERSFWFITSPELDLTEDKDYSGRVQYSCHQQRCTLTISDLRESDSAKYKFRFITSQKGGSYTGEPGVTLSVTDAPASVSVSVNPSGEIVEGTPVTLTCSSDANPAASYTWYERSNPHQPADPPKPQLALVNPSGEIVEGTPVTLTCSGDANPAASHTWYKSNSALLHSSKDIYFSSISLKDNGIYYCQFENKYGRRNSSYVQIDIQYAPKDTSVSVSHPGEIVEGSSMNLTCSSDAKPAANYTWYKENDTSPIVSGEMLTIVDIKLQHGGNYYCEARNSWGHQNSTSRLIVVSRSMKSVAAASITAVLLAVIFLPVFICIRRKRSSKQTSESRETPDLDAAPNEAPEYENLSAAMFKKQEEDQDDVQYASVHFHKNQEDPLYSIINRPKKKRVDKEEEGVVYSTVNFTHLKH